MEVKLRIREIAAQKKLTQQKLAEESGVTLQLLNRYWNNHMQRVELLALAKIARTLGASFDELIQVTE